MPKTYDHCQCDFCSGEDCAPFKEDEERRITELKTRATTAERRIADVIAELEKRCDGAGDAGDYVAQSLYNEAISLLKNGVR